MMLKDKEPTQFRHAYYSLFSRSWLKEPTIEFIAALQEDIAERMNAAGALHPLMGEGWQVIRAFLAERSPEEAADEFTHLFLGPFQPRIRPYESYYLTGRFFDAPLIALRSFLGTIGIERREGEFTDPEDMLAFELDVMRWLIGKQMEAADTEEETRWLQLQLSFLKEHLLVWAPTCAADMEKAQGARFYRGAAMMLRGFLDMERALFREIGLDNLTTLDEARRRYGARPTWKGPTFDAAGDEPATSFPFPRKEE